jgi:hypothetical protein
MTARLRLKLRIGNQSVGRRFQAETLLFWEAGARHRGGAESGLQQFDGADARRIRIGRNEFRARDAPSETRPAPPDLGAR